ncbi:hypothetical protein N7457_002235 [Penicillium paradoxum]|uniref:uncharacterized protein n=1 Tax=Penicillium paradoxum TaxID=176176 RepID=UPI002548292D|nr:uncharacterized protein N7457_002235 [Penicillium paradoxum]KAJ5787245.1 hypothetical protein N7457_002235 [Penicillium paradoxum]
MCSTRPSLMVRKFLEYNDTGNAVRQNQTAPDSSAEDGWHREPFQRGYCFFYGTLMNPHTLSQVLKLSTPPPVMRRARVIGFEIRLWGPYPALVDGKPLHQVDGMACELLSPTQLDRLAAYETDKYSLMTCLIDLLNDDGSTARTIEGVAFMWNGQQDEL